MATARVQINEARVFPRTEWENLPPGTWQVPSQSKVYLPIVDVQETGTHRVQARHRPYRDGAKLDSTGWDERHWSVELVYENSLDEPATAGRSLPIYPNQMNDLLATFFRVGSTGDLFLPTIGKSRAKVISYRRHETGDGERNGARVSVEWAEDNEESIDASTFTQASIQASARRLAEETQFTAETDGIWTGSLASLNEFVAEIEGIANLPEQNVQNVITALRIIRSNAKRLETIFSNEAQEGRDLLLDPLNSRTLRNLRRIQDMARRAEGTAMKARPATVNYVAERDTSLQAIAAKVGQSFDDLLELNQYRLDDPEDVLAGTVLRVFEVRS